MMSEKKIGLALLQTIRCANILGRSFRTEIIETYAVRSSDIALYVPKTRNTNPRMYETVSA